MHVNEAAAWNYSWEMRILHDTANIIWCLRFLYVYYYDHDCSVFCRIVYVPIYIKMLQYSWGMIVLHDNYILIKYVDEDVQNTILWNEGPHNTIHGVWTFCIYMLLMLTLSSYKILLMMSEGSA